ncbi:alkylated DNA repair alkB like 6 [Fusarium tjaetaba]|uniref:Alkylated DNA repair alkB like 6 n=1 Tax=Fusarium tjaetaba TaxID=1567544 RepID=A0A8H5S0H7_9HYPO|nr:alkylated DNA repair alkB like 6 [Fusarium tjaetaba]KAF5644620.1 alkylated DNA repair alkB like 6 [Fusarium tjaetaba]
MDSSSSALPSTDKDDVFLLPPSLQHARINTLPEAAYYIPNFITEQEEQNILDKISSAPKPRWKQLTKRRLQTWPSDLVNNKLLEAPLPLWLQDPVISRLLSMPSHDSSSANIFERSPHKKPNHVLINEYPPGIATVSLGASLCLNLHRSKEDGALDPGPAWRILQEPRSLLITTSELYTDYLHGIADIEEDVDLSAETVSNWDLLGSPDVYANGRNIRQTRTSLTYRDVLQVSKVANKLGIFLKR